MCAPDRNRVASEEVVLEAPIGGRARRREQVSRLPQGDRELGELRLMELSSHLQDQVGPPARLVKSVRPDLAGAVPRDTSWKDPDLDNTAQFRNLCTL